MRLRVLGCSGGIGDGRQTTSFLLDDDILIDAGTGVGALTLSEMAGLRHIFLTHSHLDHIAGIPLLVDSIFETLKQPITIHGQPETLAALQQHIFNWVVWPDFARLPSAERPVLRYAPMVVGESRELNGRTLTSIRVEHIVPGVGYCVQDETGATLAFSGDTCTNDSLWAALNALPRLDMLIVECAFSDQELELSRMAKHYCPQLLLADLAKLTRKVKVHLSHLKPGEETAIMAQLIDARTGHELYRLRGGDLFQL